MKTAFSAKFACLSIAFLSMVLGHHSFAQIQRSVSEDLKKSNSLQKTSTIAWSALGLGVSGGGTEVKAVAVIGSDVYVRRVFLSAGGPLAQTH